jgi:uncharacterized membrane protein YedE/YeeE
MKHALTALLCGTLFGLGLAVSGMVDPAKVQGFLDIAGHWDPSLAGVMAGAIPVAALFYRFAASRDRSLSGAPLPTPPSAHIDRRLVVGSLIFGLGWGAAGMCPGPALAAWLVDERVLFFVAAMAAGMVVQRRFFSGAP